MVQKGAGGNPRSITKKGGDGARGSTGTGRGGSNSVGGKTGARTKKNDDERTDSASAPEEGARSELEQVQEDAAKDREEEGGYQ